MPGYALQIFTPSKLRGLGIAGSLHDKFALSMEKAVRIAGNQHDNYRTYNYHRVSPKFLHPLSIDSADFPSRGPAILVPVVFMG